MNLQAAAIARPLAAHLHLAAFGRDLVLLDVRSGQYELLVGIADEVQLASNGRVAAIKDADLAAELEDFGLFGVEATAAPLRGLHQPRRSLEPLQSRRSLAREWIWMAKAWLLVLRGFYGRPFAELLASARVDRGGVPLNPSRELQIARKAQAFNRLWIWTPFAGDCFYRCFMLLRMLGDDAAGVDWVFGVRTWPFVAHCWLQLDDLVLTDSPETVSLFSPILVV